MVAKTQGVDVGSIVRASGNLVIVYQDGSAAVFSSMPQMILDKGYPSGQAFFKAWHGSDPAAAKKACDEATFMLSQFASRYEVNVKYVCLGFQEPSEPDIIHRLGRGKQGLYITGTVSLKPNDISLR